jgi:N-methylhydantoinase A/oxoprolinase/acetone carboxylase beta subunit
MPLKLGVDVGSTHTDAVILTASNEFVGAVKTKTTDDVTSGVETAIKLVIEKTGVNPSEIELAAIGTTHCINAIVERRRLAKVAVIRICLPAGIGVEPMVDWPSDLREAVGGKYFLVRGGYDYDGREFSDLDRNKLKEIAKEVSEGKFDTVAITGQFSPVRNEQELEAAEIIKSIAGEDVPISLSHEIGIIGLVERENATILNSATIPVAKAAAKAFEEALSKMNIKARLFFSQNDGTLMSVDYAKKYPVLTILSGPTNSLRGAGFLTGLSDTVVVDIGGTTTLAGMLVKGFPRQSSSVVEVGGVRTNFRMPDLVSIGNGGGSIVRRRDGEVTIGPDSVGYNIVTRSIAWGGDTVTTTDIAIAAGYASIKDDPRCDPSRTRMLDYEFVQKAVSKIVENVERAIDMIKTSKDPVPVVLVGGGGIILPPEYYNKLKGVSRVIRPENFQYANAIGAAIAQVSGEIDKVFSLEEMSREEAVKTAKKLAIEKAVAAGADPDKVQVVDVDEVFLAYLPSNAARIRVKAAGPLKRS